MNLEFNVKKESDFNKLRDLSYLKNKSIKIKINICNEIIFTELFRPINLDGIDVFINGKYHTLTNININTFETEKKYKDYSGMFERLNSLYVQDLNIEYSYVYGGTACGTLVGKVNESLTLDNVNFENLIVNSESFCGGVAGIAKHTQVMDSNITSSVYGIDVVGGIVGSSDKYVEENTEVDSEVVAIGKAIGLKVGYCEAKIIKKLK